MEWIEKVLEQASPAEWITAVVAAIALVLSCVSTIIAMAAKRETGFRKMWVLEETSESKATRPGHFRVRLVNETNRGAYGIGLAYGEGARDVTTMMPVYLAAGAHVDFDWHMDWGGTQDGVRIGWQRADDKRMRTRLFKTRPPLPPWWVRYGHPIAATFRSLGSLLQPRRREGTDEQP